MLSLKNIALYVYIGVLGMAVSFAYNRGYHHSETKWIKEVTKLNALREKEQRDKQEALNAINKEYQEKLRTIKTDSDHVINELNHKLRIKVAQAGNTNRCPIGADGKAELDREYAKRLVGITRKGDLWIAALQDTIRKLNAEQNSKKKVK